MWQVLSRLEPFGPGRYRDKSTGLVWANQGDTNRYIVAAGLCEKVHARVPTGDELRQVPPILANLLQLPDRELSFAWSNDGVMNILVRALATGEEKDVSRFGTAPHSVLCVSPQ